MLSVNGAPAVDVSVKVVETVPPPRTIMAAVTVFTCALVPAVNVVQAWPFDPVVALVGFTEIGRVSGGVREKISVVAVLLKKLLVTNAHNWLAAATVTTAL